MSRRVALLALALAALLAAPALAGTTRTSYTPEQIRAYHGSGRWDRDVGRVFAAARRSLVRAGPAERPPAPGDRPGHRRDVAVELRLSGRR